MIGLKSKVAIVTGSTGGIGKGIALKLAAEGVRVAVNGRNAETGAEVVKQIRSAGGDAVFISGDVQCLEDMRELVKATVKKWGQIDILVASTGGVERKGPAGSASGFFENIEPQAVAHAVASATLGKLNPTKAVIKHMFERNSGSILFITSEAGRFPTPGQTAGSLYAGGLIMMTKVLAKEFARYKVRVNAVAVTLVRDTPAWDRFVAKTDSDVSRFTKIQKKASFGLAEPKDIAEVAAFLVSDGAGFITGSTISPTGGVTFS